MVLLGKTYGNLMVDLQAKSKKLAARSRKILIDMFNIDVKEAEKLLSKSSSVPEKKLSEGWLKELGY